LILTHTTLGIAIEEDNDTPMVAGDVESTRCSPQTKLAEADIAAGLDASL
jgi:hypothetical protein